MPITLGDRADRVPLAMTGQAGDAAPVTDGRTFELEPPGTTENSGSGSAHLRLVPRARSIDAIRHELLEAHRLHVAALEMQDAADKAARLAGHNTVEKMARIQQLRTELVRVIEQPAEVA
ncbi:MAG TPA: hypothetical protein VGR82_17515 [Methylomirabilota bacterium]|nr:hypothetical protein [Methylomirabilota bacterium]